MADIRGAFELHHFGGNKHNSRRNEAGDYVIPAVSDAWGGWQSAAEYYAAQLEQARREEREACARIAAKHEFGAIAANAIRARNKQ